MITSWTHRQPGMIWHVTPSRPKAAKSPADILRGAFPSQRYARASAVPCPPAIRNLPVCHPQGEILRMGSRGITGSRGMMI